MINSTHRTLKVVVQKQQQQAAPEQVGNSVRHRVIGVVKDLNTADERR